MNLLKISAVGLTMLAVVYIFSYLPITTANELKNLCNKYLIGSAFFDSSKISIPPNITITTHEKADSKSGLVIFAGGWMTSCHVSYENGKVVKANFVQD